MTDAEKLNRIKELDNRTCGFAVALQLLEELLIARSEARKHVEVKPLSDEEVRTRLQRGEPAVSRENVDPCPPWLMTHATNVRQILKRYGLLPMEPIEIDLQMPFAGSEAARSRAAVTDCSEGETLLGRYVVLQILKPFYEECRNAYLPIVAGLDWFGPYCPICGGPPVMGKRVSEGGRRYLCCALCDMSWPYMTLKCPFCENERQSMLFSFHVEGTSFHVDGCRLCGRYLKVIDERSGESNETFVELDDIRSFQLDGAAIREGLRSG